MALIDAQKRLSLMQISKVWMGTIPIPVVLAEPPSVGDGPDDGSLELEALRPDEKLGCNEAWPLVTPCQEVHAPDDTEVDDVQASEDDAGGVQTLEDESDPDDVQALEDADGTGWDEASHDEDDVGWGQAFEEGVVTIGTGGVHEFED
ncbi:hypothetical protein ACEQ8H_008556 [Pleosporales sp. CAS-2024a]